MKRRVLADIALIVTIYGTLGWLIYMAVPK